MLFAGAQVAFATEMACVPSFEERAHVDDPIEKGAQCRARNVGFIDNALFDANAIGFGLVSQHLVGYWRCQPIPKLLVSDCATGKTLVLAQKDALHLRDRRRYPQGYPIGVPEKLWKTEVWLDYPFIELPAGSSMTAIAQNAVRQGLVVTPIEEVIFNWPGLQPLCACELLYSEAEESDQ